MENSLRCIPATILVESLPLIFEESMSDIVQGCCRIYDRVTSGKSRSSQVDYSYHSGIVSLSNIRGRVLRRERSDDLVPVERGTERVVVIDLLAESVWVIVKQRIERGSEKSKSSINQNFINDVGATMNVSSPYSRHENSPPVQKARSLISSVSDNLIIILITSISRNF